MPYKSADTQREYQREWHRKRRKTWFDANGPCVQCGSWEDLELDHIDRQTKVTSRIWSWSQIRRDEELAKCQVLCHVCHLEKTAKEVREWTVYGEQNGQHKLVESEVREIKMLLAEKVSTRTLSKMFGVHRRTIQFIKNGTSWKYLL